MSQNVKITEAGQSCRHCGCPVVRQWHKSPPPAKPGGYYFEWWLRCPGCHTLYMVEAAKRYFSSGTGANPAPPSGLGTAVAIDHETDAYRHQDPGDDGIPPW